MTCEEGKKESRFESKIILVCVCERVTKYTRTVGDFFIPFIFYAIRKNAHYYSISKFTYIIEKKKLWL